MKHTEKKYFLCGLSAVAALMAGILFPSSSMAQVSATSQDTVSAIGEAVPAAPDQSATGQSVVEEGTDTGLTAMPADDAFPPPPTAVAAPKVEPVAPVPAQTDLTGSAAPVDPRTQTSSGVAEGGNVMGDTGVKEKHSGLYYDSKVPNNELSAAGISGPRKVDPAVEPGSRYIIVDKTAGAMSYEAQYVSAGRALKLGRYAAAMEMFEQLYAKNRREPRVLMGLAVAQQGAGFSESAAKTYEDLLEVEPNNADAIINLMGIMKGQYPSVTLQRLLELRNKYPANPGVPAQIGLVNAELKNYDDAIHYLEIAASMDPKNPSYIYNMAIITDRQGHSGEAVKLYERALQLDASFADTAQGLPRDEIYDRLVVLRRKA